MRKKYLPEIKEAVSYSFEQKKFVFEYFLKINQANPMLIEAIIATLLMNPEFISYLHEWSNNLEYTDIETEFKIHLYRFIQFFSKNNNPFIAHPYFNDFLRTKKIEEEKNENIGITLTEGPLQKTLNVCLLRNHRKHS